MATTKQSTVVGVFEDRAHAEQAVEALHRAGFTDKQIGILAPHTPVGAAATDEDPQETMADEGIGIGLVAGSFLGGLLGAVATGLIPGVGPVLAAGVMAGIIGGSALGGVAGSLIGMLVGLGIPEHHATLYEKEFKAGRTLVTVHPDGREAEVFAIFGQFHAYDVAAAYGSEVVSTTAGK
jgi:hypothetical protein